MHLIGFISIFYLWTAIFHSTNSTLPYTLPEIITYYILAGIIAQLTESHFEHEINNDVRQGTLNNHILKPFSYIQLNIMRSVGWHSIQVIIAGLVYAVIIFFLRDFFIINTNIIQIEAIIIMMILASLFFVTISLLLGSLSFWMINASPLFNIREVLITFMTGALVPINFFPETIQHIFSLLPFQYLVFTPVNIYLGKLSNGEIFKAISILLFWTVVNGSIAIFVWKKGLTKYEGVGL